jgi:nucleoside 2-deoxyribosyltransferase
MTRIYLAGGLFNAGQRLHNLFLEKYLREFGFEVVLPQREALKRFYQGSFDKGGLREDCRESCTAKSSICVANIDGADADSGTSIEYGMAITATGRAVVYRTDFRTAEDLELGLNAMFVSPGTSFVYLSCFFTDLKEVEGYYRALAAKICVAVQALERTP